MISQIHRRILFLFAIVVLFTQAIPAQVDIPSQTIDRYLTVRSEMGNFSGAVLVAKDEKIVLRKGYGLADVERKIPYTPKTRHDVASISKMFTAFAALKLRDAGKLKLEDSICNYLDDCPAIWQPITVQQLMRHNSGIPDYEEPLVLGSEKYLAFMKQPNVSARIIENAKKLPLDFKPGEKFTYSNTGYMVLSYVVQKAAQQPFAEFVEKNILKPAGMKSSGVLDLRKMPKNLAVGYSSKDIGWEKTLAGVSLTDGHLQKVPELPHTPPEGDGGLYSTIDDLYRWGQIMDGGKFVSAAEIAEIFTPGIDGYGYGWFIDKNLDRKRFEHSGGMPGYISDFIKFPDDKITIIIFSNIDRARLGSMTRTISAILLEKPFDMPVRGQVVKLTAEQIAVLEGDYKMSDGKLLNISNTPTFLTAKLQDRYTAGLIPLSPTEFYFPLGDGKAIFTLDNNGKAARVNMRYNGTDHIAERVNQP